MPNDDTIPLDELILTCKISELKSVSTTGYNRYNAFSTSEDTRFSTPSNLEIVQSVPNTLSGKILVRPKKMRVFKSCDSFLGCNKENLEFNGWFYTPCVEVTGREYNDMKLAKYKELSELAGITFISGMGPIPSYFLSQLFKLARQNHKSVFRWIESTNQKLDEEEILHIVQDIVKSSNIDIISDDDAIAGWSNLELDTRLTVSRLMRDISDEITGLVNIEMPVSDLIAVTDKPGHNCSSLRGCCCCMDKEEINIPNSTRTVTRMIIKNMISNIDEAECYGNQKDYFTKVGQTFKKLGEYDKTTWSWAPEIGIDGNPTASKCLPSNNKSDMQVITGRTAENNVFSTEIVKLCDGNCETPYWIVYCKDGQSYINKENILKRGQRIEGILNIHLSEILDELDDSASEIKYYGSFDEAESDFRERVKNNICAQVPQNNDCDPCKCTKKIPFNGDKQTKTIYAMVCDKDYCDCYCAAYNSSNPDEMQIYCDMIKQNKVFFISQTSGTAEEYLRSIDDPCSVGTDWCAVYCDLNIAEPQVITGLSYQDIVDRKNTLIAAYKCSTGGDFDPKNIIGCNQTYPCDPTKSVNPDGSWPANRCIELYYLNTGAVFPTEGVACPFVCRDETGENCDCSKINASSSTSYGN